MTTDRNNPDEITKARSRYVIRLPCGCERHTPNGIHRATIRKINGKCKIKHKHLNKTQWWGEFAIKCGKTETRTTIKGNK